MSLGALWGPEQAQGFPQEESSTAPGEKGQQFREPRGRLWGGGGRDHI